MRLVRLFKIIFVVLRFGLDEFLLGHQRLRWMRVPLNVLLFFRSTRSPRAERLRRAGWRQAIASSAPRLNIEAMLAAMGVQECFQAVVAAEEVHTGKPDPEVFLLAAARLGVAPPECIVVEDSAAGVEGARRAGMRSIGVRRSGEPLPADLFVASLADLAPDAFDRLAGLNA